jgi:hypothetical protein
MTRKAKRILKNILHSHVYLLKKCYPGLDSQCDLQIEEPMTLLILVGPLPILGRSRFRKVS